jgi:hypothetical protein
MDHDTYMARMAEIRAELYASHLEAVRAYPGSAPKEALEHIIGTYEPIETIDRIIAAEKPNRPPPAKPKLGMGSGP